MRGRPGWLAKWNEESERQLPPSVVVVVVDHHSHSTAVVLTTTIIIVIVMIIVIPVWLPSLKSSLKTSPLSPMLQMSESMRFWNKNVLRTEQNEDRQ
jgi:hypothetical protein